MKLSELETPALVLNRDAMMRNIAAMNQTVKRQGVRLRPHLKTSKCLEVARLATAEHSGGVTVSTLNEAEYFADRGFNDLIYAVCVTPQKLKRIAALQKKQQCRLTIIIDSLVMARELVDAARSLDAHFHVMIELDCGEGRTGINHRNDQFLNIARLLHEDERITLVGVLTHAGHSYGCRTVDEIVRVAEQERQETVAAAEKLIEHGIPCPERSIGSTPTAIHARNLEGITEIRPGVFVFGDLFQSAIFSCRREDIALAVLATVISHRPDQNRMVLDAGGLALSKDRSTASTDQDAGYGLLTDLHGHLIDGLYVSGVHQEHGEVTATGPIDFSRYPIGTRLRVLPNHACMTAAMYNNYHVVDEGSETVTAVWQRTNGWDSGHIS